MIYLCQYSQKYQGEMHDALRRCPLSLSAVRQFDGVLLRQGGGRMIGKKPMFHSRMLVSNPTLPALFFPISLC